MIFVSKKYNVSSHHQYKMSHSMVYQSRGKMTSEVEGVGWLNTNNTNYHTCTITNHFVSSKIITLMFVGWTGKVEEKCRIF